MNKCERKTSQTPHSLKAETWTRTRNNGPRMLQEKALTTNSNSSSNTPLLLTHQVSDNHHPCMKTLIMPGKEV